MWVRRALTEKVSKEKASRIRRPCATRLLITAWRINTKLQFPKNALCAFFIDFFVTQAAITQRFCSCFVIASAARQSRAHGLPRCARNDEVRVDLNLNPDCPSPQRRRTGLSSARNRAAALSSARLSFGYFSLAKQRKVSRPPGRIPAYKTQSKKTQTMRKSDAQPDKTQATDRNLDPASSGCNLSRCDPL